MRFLFVLLYSTQLLADTIPTVPFPVFLRQGFSSVLEFEEAPTRVVLGDSQNFQVEKLDKSLILKTLAPYATTNMFVYFKEKDPKIFILTASEEADPTYHRKFEAMSAPKQTQIRKSNKVVPMARGIRIVSAKFEGRKDYLTVDFEVSADSTAAVRPNWELIRLAKGNQVFAPSKLWSSRREVQKDSRVKGRLIFVKPNLGADLRSVVLVVPLQGEPTPMKVTL